MEKDGYNLSPPKPFYLSKKFWCLVYAALILFGLVFIFTSLATIFNLSVVYGRMANNEENEKADEYPIVDGAAGTLNYDNDAIPDDLEIFFSRRIADNYDGKSRNYPTLEVWHKNGKAPAELLATVGQVYKYPNLAMSPDGKYVVVNFEDELDLLDIKTKELKKIFTAEHKVSSYTFSKDNSKILILDHNGYDRQDRGYTVYRLSLADGDSERLFSGTDLGVDSGCPGIAYLGNWYDDEVGQRDSNFIVEINCGLGEIGQGPYILDLVTGEFSQGQDFSVYGAGSCDGTIYSGTDYEVVITKNADDLCNSFSGVGPGLYEVRAKDSGEAVGSFGTDGQLSYFVAFAPDDSAVLYYQLTSYPPEDSLDQESICAGRDGLRKYYVWRAATNTSDPIDDYYSVLDQWKELPKIVGSYLYSYQGPESRIYLDDKPIVTSATRTNSLSLIKAYQN